jgi:hypothetical protein
MHAILISELRIEISDLGFRSFELVLVLAGEAELWNTYKYSA